ncbi:hypothetical protein ACFFLM_10180 [Deinococcus oregonensis]|uniref:Uncharacterized protein n=1 Tax=Deinococcus oregonensis TaxID=1805970 RepID=A0ABV6B002_9DEIO
MSESRALLGVARGLHRGGSMFQPQFKPLLQVFARASAAIVLSAACAASAAQTTFRLTVTVLGTCEIQGQDAAGITLRCTKGFSPSDPRAVSTLVDKLPAQPLKLVSTQPAPNGGTLNTYAVSPAQAAPETESGLVAFY